MDECRMHKVRRRAVADNWGKELPQDLLDTIVEHLPVPRDLIRFGAVCTSWRHTVVQHNRPFNVVPWLIVTHSGDAQHCWFDPLTGHSQLIPYHDADPQKKFRRRLIGSGHGWVVVYDEDTEEARLFNPLTNAHIDLPPLPFRDCAASVLLSGTGIQDGYVMLYRHKNPSMYFVLEIGSANKQWKSLYTSESGDMYCDFVAYKGQIYAINTTNKAIAVLDCTVQPYRLKDVVALPDKYQNGHHATLYLVLGVEELLLCVRIRRDAGFARSMKRPSWKWRVYRVEMAEGTAEGTSEKAKLVRMRSIKNGAIFLSWLSSVYVSELPAFAGGDAASKCKGNCIYFCEQARSYVWEFSLVDNTDELFYTYKGSEKISIWPVISSLWVVPHE